MNNTTAANTIHGHPISEDGRTCVFFAQCPANSDLDLYLSTYEIALTHGIGEQRARRCAEAYMAGRIGALPTFVR
jgi:hypothetical protein